MVRERCADLGPTFAREKLAEVHGLKLSAETLRKWMAEDGLRRVKPRRGSPVRQRRPRRPCLDELIQIDGSEHAWFEDRGPRCSLILFIDDATGRLLALRFVSAETTEAYMGVLRGYLDGHGRPVAVYSDRHGVFRVNHRDREGELTQFGRALKTLDIEPTHAGSPQAKGRVERANGTLQDRLVKEMWLRDIDGMEAGNAFLPEFMEDFNRRFAAEPLCPADAHRQVLHDAAELGLILSLHSTRKVSRNLPLQYKGREHQIQVKGRGYGLRGARVTVCEGFDGRVSILRDGRPLAFRVLAEGEPPVAVEDEKSVCLAVDRAKARQAGAPELEARPGSSLEAGGAHRCRARRGGGAVTSGRSVHGPAAGESRSFLLEGAEKGTFLLWFDRFLCSRLSDCAIPCSRDGEGRMQTLPATVATSTFGRTRDNLLDCLSGF